MDFSDEYKKYEEIKVEIEVLKEKKQRKKEELLKKRLAYKDVCYQLYEEKKDVDQLEKLSLAQILAKISGKFEEKHEKEYLEYVNAKRMYDEASYAIEVLEQEILQLEREVERISQKCLSQEEYLISTFEEAKKMNQKINKEREEHLRMKKEYMEAIIAVNRTLRIANEIKDLLSSAKSCATFDTFFGGGLWTDMVKYLEIDKAQNLQNELTQATSSMKKELLDVDISFQGNSVEIDETTKVFDIFFDNIFADWNVRKEIKENCIKMEEYIRKLEMIRSDLIERKHVQEEAINSCQI